MRLGHLGGWNVRKLPLTATNISEAGVTTIDAPGFAIVRTNPFTGQPEALGVVGGGFTPLQNEDHAEFLNRLADESGVVFDIVGSLRGGRQVHGETYAEPGWGITVVDERGQALTTG